MTRGMIYKGLFIAAIVVFAVMLILPTFGDKELWVVLKDDITAEQIDAVKTRFPLKSYTITQKKEKSGKVLLITGTNLTDATMNEIKQFPGVSDARFLKHWAEHYLLARKINLGLDLQGGMHLVLKPADLDKVRAKAKADKEDEDQAVKNQINQALELIRNRVDKFGVSEPSIRLIDVNIEVQLPGVKDPDAVKKLIGTTGKVEYHLVDEALTGQARQWLAANVKDAKLPAEDAERTKLLVRIAEGINLSDKKQILYYYERQKQTKKIQPSYPIVLEREVALAGNEINKAWTGRDEYGGLSVHFSTTSEGAAKFATATSPKNKGKRLAIVIDEKVRSAPAINYQITGGQAMITGDFNKDEVDTLARIIQEGALPVTLLIAEEKTIGPTLGQDAIDSGLRAALVGFAGVVLFMLVYYKMAGLIADLGLVLTIIFQMALLSWLGFTLTLPGIAGIILNFGMAVDANVIIYERMKEELKKGKSVRLAVITGYQRAFWAIFDSNMTTIFAAFILFQFGTGPIKGFAVTLFIGILTSMVSALYISRFIFEVISLNRKIKKLSI